MPFEKHVFSEHFEKDGMPNPEYWVHEIGPKWFNNEKQAYVDSRENSFVKDGVLHLRATLHDEAPRYTSARLASFGKKAWQYGRFVIRAKLPRGIGSWPAIWMMPEDSRQGVHWPFCGEIDIMEHRGSDPERVHFSLHTKTYNHTINTHKTIITTVTGACEAFHDYEFQWDEKRIAFYIDGALKTEFLKSPTDGLNEWPFDKPFFMILNVAVGGFWGGAIRDEDLPFEMQIAAIDVYQ